MITWGLGFTLDIPNFIGIGGHFFDRKSGKLIF
jgi:hypothetical protein